MLTVDRRLHQRGQVDKRLSKIAELEQAEDAKNFSFITACQLAVLRLRNDLDAI